MQRPLLASCAATIVAAAMLYGCAQIKQISDALTNLQRLQFKLGAVHNFRLAGVDLSSKSSLGDFNPVTEAPTLIGAFRTGRLPAEFTLDLEVRNPNDGSSGTSRIPATLTDIEFRLLIDDQPTITGNLGREVEIPASGAATVVPIHIQLDLAEFFGKQGYEKLLDLALAIGGKNGSSSRLKLDAKPTVRTKFGSMSYPGRITVVDKEFRN